ncbi:Gfo/Idh/MocA family protein [Halovenus marina]|uniref:Gfo/Idh/MocA family protein n=1 Tax=Halovenus marina TaxID=3396621 RepID=UPI003F57E34F
MTWNVAGINFAHFHMGDQLGYVEDHPDARIAAICDENPEIATLSLETTAEQFDLDDDQVFTDHERCLESTDVDLVITCPVPTEHAEWVENLAEYDVSVQLEKPFATSVEECERAMDAMDGSAGELAVNWPLAWYPTHRTAKRLVDEGRIGELIEVHYYNGNRGGQRFTEVEYGDEGEMHFMGDLDGGGPIENVEARDRGDRAWWHDPEKGGGSLIDYLGYGTTLGTWFRGGELPVSVTADAFYPDHMDVDTHCIAVAKYETGLSKFESRWGTFTDPWIDQPQPQCGFVLVGTEGTIASYDYSETVRVQDADTPEGYEVELDEISPPMENPVQYMLDRMERGEPVEYGPLRPALNRDAQRITDAVTESAERGAEVML